jgi:hypothetical protein
MEASVGVDIDRSFAMRGQGSPIGDDMSDLNRAGQPMPIGDAELDNVVEIRGAPQSQYQAIRQQPELRALIKQVIGEWGAYILEDKITLKTQTIPQTTEQITAYLTPVLELAQWIQAPSAPRQAPATGTQAAIALRGFHERPEAEKQALLRDFLERIGPQLGQGQVIDAKYWPVEWRGMVGNHQARVKLNQGSGVDIEAKVDNPHGKLYIQHNPKAVPRVGAPPAWDEDDVQLLFLGHGVFIGDSPSGIDLIAQRLKALPPEFGPTIADAMHRNQIDDFGINTFKPGIEVDFDSSLVHMLDPEGQIIHTMQVVRWVADLLQATPPSEHDANAPSGPFVLGPVKTTCAYCQTNFVSGTTASCPNCGAPVTA